MISKVRVEEAIGLTLAHDITKVVPGGFKGPAFRRGHIIRTEDITEFLRIGKEHIFILDLDEGQVHEEEAALRIARAVMGPGLVQSKPKEGRVNLTTAFAGLLRINVGALDAINSLGEIIIATAHTDTVCKEGARVAAMRIIPLCIHEEKLARMEQIAGESQAVISVLPMKLTKIGLIVTGNEVFKGRIKDEFSGVMRRKVEALGCCVHEHVIVTDDRDAIAQAILAAQAKGCEVILCCSGMSVDPDDVTPEGIRRSGAEVRFYGVPVVSGAMSLYAKLGDTHILGVPACTMHAPNTAFDKLFPIILTGEELSFDETRKLGHGGLCLKCEKCAYPVCPFCK
jgi:hypothetical protein